MWGRRARRDERPGGRLRRRVVAEERVGRVGKMKGKFFEAGRRDLAAPSLEFGLAVEERDGDRFARAERSTGRQGRTGTRSARRASLLPSTRKRTSLRKKGRQKDGRRTSSALIARPRGCPTPLSPRLSCSQGFRSKTSPPAEHVPVEPSVRSNKAGSCRTVSPASKPRGRTHERNPSDGTPALAPIPTSQILGAQRKRETPTHLHLPSNPDPHLFAPNGLRCGGESHR